MGPDPYRELFERSADAILIIEGDTFVDCNQATVELLGYENRAQLLETHPSELSPPTQPDGRDSFEKANEMIAIAFENDSHRFEWDHLRADGVIVPVEVLLTAVQRGDQPILHVVWRDITERKELEHQLRHAQKMEAVGRLAAGIAHDFNNLLVPIIGNAELLSMELADRPDQVALLAQIGSAGQRASSLVRQLLTFSRKHTAQPQTVDLNEVVATLRDFLERLLGGHVKLVATQAAAPALIEIDPGQLEQVIVNLVTNARDAMPSGGTISIEVRRTTVGSLEEGAFGDLEPGHYAVLSVSDTGMGMDEATVQKAFDPFFTTKELGRGTGLGLSTVFGISRQARGGASIWSVPGKGTTIKVALPISASERAPLPIQSEDGAICGGSETILVAEDEPAVSDFVLKVLGDNGYRLLLARDGAGALALWERHAGEIDLLLTDVVMPGLGGPELVRRLRQS